MVLEWFPWYCGKYDSLFDGDDKNIGERKRYWRLLKMHSCSQYDSFIARGVGIRELLKMLFMFTFWFSQHSDVN
jgi:hypothetical protein